MRKTAPASANAAPLLFESLPHEPRHLRYAEQRLLASITAAGSTRIQRRDETLCARLARRGLVKIYTYRDLAGLRIVTACQTPDAAAALAAR